MTAFAWAVLCPHHEPALRLDHGSAMNYATAHHGTVIELMRADHLREMIHAAFEAGFAAAEQKHGTPTEARAA